MDSIGSTISQIIKAVSKCTLSFVGFLKGKTMKELSCKECGGVCCKAFYTPPLITDLKEFLMALWWMMPHRIMRGIKRNRVDIFESMCHRIDNVFMHAHKLLFRVFLTKQKDPWFLARGQKGWFAVRCRLFRNGKCSVYGWIGDHVRPGYCRDFTCNGQYEGYIYKQYEKEKK